MTKKIVSRDQEVVFTNWTDEDFEHTYDMGHFAGPNGEDWIAKRKLYRFPKGKSFYLPFYLAEIFAKHLAQREYNKQFQGFLEEEKAKPDVPNDRRVLENKVQMKIKMTLQEMMDKCVEVIPVDESQIGMAKSQEVKMREVVLNKDTRAEELREKYGTDFGNKYVNDKALKQEEFEEAKV